MTDREEDWQRRIRDLYANVDELYSHVDITVVVFDRELVDVNPNGVTPNPLTPLLTEIARRVVDTGEPERDVALDQIGRQRVHAYPLRDDATTVGVVCVVDDDGARRELFVRCAMAIFDGYRQNEARLLERERTALQEARTANVLRDQFLAAIAHELRSPMSSILLWEQVLRNDSLDSETRIRALDAIRESATGQALLVADLLDVSRAINGKLHIDRRPIPIARVIAMAIDSARPFANARHLEIHSHLDPDLGVVHGDSRRLRQVFDNLLSNAVKCTHHGQISVHARQDDQSITIDVCDTGRGISPHFLPHIFEPFRQGGDGAESGGLGLGLAIASQLVALHDGTLSAASDGVERGATFTVTLPRVAAKALDRASTSPTIAGVRILVVDDDTRIAEALKLLFESLGAIVVTVDSATAAYRVLQRDQTDVLLSDLAMPGEDGHSLVRKIRQTPGVMKSLPAIALTAHIGEEARTQALDAGFDRYVTKPVDFAVLVSNIAELVR